MSPPPPSSPWWRSRRRCCKKSDEGKPKRKFFFLLRRCHVHAFFMTKMTLAQESRVSSLARAPSRAHTVWSVNDGLSGNLLETSGNRPQRFLASSRISTIEKKFLKQELYIKNLETSRKPPQPASFRRFPEVFGHSIIDGPHGTYKTRKSSSCFSFAFTATISQRP